MNPILILTGAAGLLPIAMFVLDIIKRKQKALAAVRKEIQ
jgi:hypothetical protein